MPPQNTAFLEIYSYMEHTFRVLKIMTEVEWLTSEDPQQMLAWLCTPGDVGLQGGYGRKGAEFDRKLRLFACACCRQVWELLTDRRSCQAVAMAEAYADGKVSSTDRGLSFNSSNHIDDPAERFLVRATLRFEAAYGANQAASCLLMEQYGPPKVAALLRCFFGNPFRWLDKRPGWLVWRGTTAIKLAQAIYDERAFERLPILADALEEAGVPADEQCSKCNGKKVFWVSDRFGMDRMDCSNCNGTGRVPHPLLVHCRDGGIHCRGCWVVDLILGRE